ncbi:MAG: VOC family protein [Gammaproteobacteria bacterium]
MSKAIHIVTISCADLSRSVQAYQDYLHYRQCYNGQVSAQQAGLWQCPRLVGAAQALLQPGNGSEHYLRLVQQPAAGGYRAFADYGWNAIEILVRDVDSLAGELAGSPFRIEGPPADLSFTDKIRAMQVTGMAQEVLYLTEIKDAVAGFELPFAKDPVEHCFVMILGAADIRQTQQFYRQQFALAETPVIDARVTVMSAAFDLQRDHLHPITALNLSAGYLLEIDQMPAAATPRQVEKGWLPPGIAMVTFAVDDLVASDPHTLDIPPYNNKPAALVRGPNGELVELLQHGVA